MDICKSDLFNPAISARERALQVLAFPKSEVKVRSATLADTKTPPPPDSHVNMGGNAVRLIGCLSGSHPMLVPVGGTINVLPMKRGHFAFLPPNSWHRTIWEKDRTFFSIVFHNSYTRVVWGKWSKSDLVPSPFTRLHATYHTPHRLAGIMIPLVRAAEQVSGIPQDSRSLALLVEVILREVLAGILRQPEEPNSKSRMLWQNICHFIEENLNHELSLISVGDAFNIHPNHVSRLFRSCGDEGFNSYVIRLRMDLAARLLNEHDWTVEDTALACGFRDASYFSRVFLRHYDVKPSVYRDNNCAFGQKK